MAVPTIALYASPPSGVYSTPYPCQINSHTSYDFNLTGRLSSSSTASVSLSKPIVGGLSSLFSSSSKLPSSRFASRSYEEGAYLFCKSPSSSYIKFAHQIHSFYRQSSDSRSVVKKHVQVIDFSLKQLMQWPALMQALALRSGGPPTFRLTGIGPPIDDNTDHLQQVGWKLVWD